MKPTIVLEAHDLAIAAALIGLDGLISLVFGLGLHRQLAVAAIRMVLQLLLIGVILTRVFALASPPVTLLVVLVMVAIGGREVAVRPEQRIKLGSELAAIGREFGGVDLDLNRDETPAGVVSFD